MFLPETRYERSHPTPVGVSRASPPWLDSARHEPELVRVLGQGLDYEGDVLVLVDAELLDPAPDLVAVDLGRERGLLELLADRLRRHSLDPGRADECAGADEARQLV